MRKPIGLILAWLVVGGVALPAALVAQDVPTPKEKLTADVPRGPLPTYWKRLGLSDEQRVKITTLGGKYQQEIDRLEAQIVELKAKKLKDQLAVLTEAQKKQLEEIYKQKAGTDK